jgi:hypothetical protein
MSLSQGFTRISHLKPKYFVPWNANYQLEENMEWYDTEKALKFIKRPEVVFDSKCQKVEKFLVY